MIEIKNHGEGTQETISPDCLKDYNNNNHDNDEDDDDNKQHLRHRKGKSGWKSLRSVVSQKGRTKTNLWYHPRAKHQVMTSLS